MYTIQIKQLKEDREANLALHEHEVTSLKHKQEDARKEWERDLVNVQLQHKEQCDQLKEQIEHKSMLLWGCVVAVVHIQAGKLARQKSMTSLQQAAALTKSRCQL